MASLKYFLLSPFVFLCLSCTFANRVLNSDDGSSFDFGPGVGLVPRPGSGVEGGVSSVVAGPRAGPKAGLGVEGGVNNVGAGPKAGPRIEGGASSVGAGPRAEPRARQEVEGGVSNVGAGPKAGPGAGPRARQEVEGGVSNVGAGPKAGPGAGPRARQEVEGGVSNVGAGPKAGPGAGPRAAGGSVRRGVDPIVNGIGLGVEVGYGPGSGYWPGPILGPGGLYDDDCVLGYVCGPNGRRGCNKFAYETCDSYFHPLTAAMDVHEVEINWAKSKPVGKAQHGVSEKLPSAH